MLWAIKTTAFLNQSLVQYFKYGRKGLLTTIKHLERSQLRGKLPFFLVLMSIAILSIDLLLTEIRLFVPEAILLGICLVFCESCRTTWKCRHKIDSEIWRGNQPPPSLILHKISLYVKLFPRNHHFVM